MNRTPKIAAMVALGLSFGFAGALTAGSASAATPSINKWDGARLVQPAINKWDGARLVQPNLRKMNSAPTTVTPAVKWGSVTLVQPNLRKMN